MKSVIRIFLLAGIAGSLLSSCRKDREEDFNESQLVAIDQNQADNASEDAANMVGQVMDVHNQKLTKSGRVATGPIVINPDSIPFDPNKCAIVTLVPKQGTEPGSLTIDFGTTGCRCKDGRTRKGKMISTFTDRLKVTGAKITTNYQDFAVTKGASLDFIQIDNSSTKETITEAVSADGAVVNVARKVNMKMTPASGTTFSFIADKKIELNFGVPGIWEDNIYTTKVGSTQSGIDRKGRNYTMVVDKDVVRKAECTSKGVYKPVSGQVTISHDSKKKVVDFGTGTCDNSVNITIDGKRTITRW